MSSTTLKQLAPLQVLHDSPIMALRCLSLEESDTAVVINGDLPTYYLKQLAQETLRPVLAGRQLVNQVRVIRNTLSWSEKEGSRAGCP
jgi:hypothetical protein